MLPENYKMQYTWFQDFKIATAFGEKAVRDTYRRAYKEWKNDVVAMMELTFALNIFCWELFYANREPLSKVYSDLYYDCYNKCTRKFKGDDLRKYCEFLD